MLKHCSKNKRESKKKKITIRPSLNINAKKTRPSMRSNKRPNESEKKKRGKKKMWKFVDITAIHRKLGDSLCASLPGFHAFSGCDTTSGFPGKGKKILVVTPKSILAQFQHPCLFAYLLAHS